MENQKEIKLILEWLPKHPNKEISIPQIFLNITAQHSGSIIPKAINPVAIE
jgi:hypothetical protein